MCMGENSPCKTIHYHSYPSNTWQTTLKQFAVNEETQKVQEHIKKHANRKSRV